MKNKKLTYVLIPLVLLVWGLIIYRIVNTVSTNDGEQRLEKPLPMVNDSQPILTDTFSIEYNFRDPFLGKNSVQREPSSDTKPKTATVVVPKKPVEVIVWPSIVYGGLIKNEKSSTQLVFVQINGQVNIMKEGAIVNGIQLTKIFRDSIEVSFNKNKKFIVK